MNNLYRTTFFSLFFFLSYSSNLKAQVTFERVFGEDDFTEGFTVEELSDNNFLVGGRKEGKPYIVKTDEFGQLIWDLVVEEPGMDQVKSIVETSDFNYLVAGGNNNQSPFIIKVSQDGDILWDVTNDMPDYVSGVHDLCKVGDSHYAILTTPEYFSEAMDASIVEINEEGDIINEIIYQNEEAYDRMDGLLRTSDGGYLILGQRSSTEGYNLLIVKMNDAGDFQWEYLNEEVNNLNVSENVIENSEGDIVFSAGDVLFGKLSNNGELLTKVLFGQVPYPSYIPKSIAENENGNYLITGSYHYSPNEEYYMFLTQIDANGLIVFEELLGGEAFDFGESVRTTQDNGIVLTGANTLIGPNSGRKMYLVKTNAKGQLIKNIVYGKINFDQNINCEEEDNEVGLHSFFVRAEAPNTYFYDISDADGYYEINVDSGSYNLNLMPINDYWGSCQNLVSTGLLSSNDTIQIDFQTIALVDCSALTINITTPFLRRCFDTNYTVNYCNQGTIPAENAYIEITFDQYLTPNSSTLPWTSVTEQTYTFELGDVAVQECGTFYINVSVGCEDEGVELGQTHCVEAHIYPDSLCNPADPLWDGSNIIVDAECEEDSVRFFIRNTGEGDMDSPQEYIIIEDHIIFLQEPYEIPSGEEIEIAVPTDGVAYRMETAQNPGHPIGNMPSINVTGCNVDEIPDFLLNFWNIYPDDDISPFISVDCQQNIGSFDPNDKQAFPIGYGEEHFIEANTEIEYLIRFQNTGTDTAFTVVIEDVLSEYLDITSIRMGASSHPYDFDIENGRKLKFTFNNILLPDSTTNEVASHGFIKFKVDQVADNQIGTWIENNAAIFFDFNAPVITNTVFHEVGEDFIESVVSSTLEVSEEEKRVFVSPNPFSDETFFRIKSIYSSPVKFTLHDAQGRLVREEIYRENSFTFLRKGLSEGLYFYRIEEEGVLIDAGKIVVN